MRRISELALGIRLSVGGGRSGWVRLALIAVGVGLGVTMLLVAASIPTVLDARTERADARSVTWDQQLTPGEPTMLTQEVKSSFRDAPVVGLLLQPEHDDAPLPPGVPRQLEPGDLVVSPALGDLLASDNGAALRDRWGDRVVGTIGDEGLTGPDELRFYLGTDQLTAGSEYVDRIQSFGGADGSSAGLGPVLLLLALVGMVVLLLPVAIFISTAVRFGSENRDRRLAALRLVGADVGMTRRIAAGETLAGAAGGLAVGTLLFLAIGRLAAYAVPAELSFYPEDLRPAPVLAALTVVLVPATTVLVTLSALKQVLVEPLGVVRRGSERRRRFWWRLVVPVVGLALLTPLIDGLDTSPGSQVMVVAGLILVLVGVALILPWLVEATVHRLNGCSVAWDLAVRRLQLDSGTAVRSVSGIAVSVAGLIAMQGLVATIGELSPWSQADTSTFQATVLDIDPEADSAETWERELSRAEGVTRVGLLTSMWARPTPATAGQPASSDETLIDIGTCEVLAQEAQLDSCDDGDAFVVAPDGTTTPASGSVYLLGTGQDTRWTLPASAEVVGPAPGTVGSMGGMSARIMVTPGALGGIDVEPEGMTVYVALDPAVLDAADHMRTAAAQVDPAAYESPIAPERTTLILGNVQSALLVGTVALLVLIGASMLVNVIEQLRERRQLLAVLVAFGTRRRTLGASVLFQVAIPVVLGLAIAVVTGSVLALALQAAVDAPLAFDWLTVGVTSGAAALMVLLTTAAGLPLLWHLTRPGGLRSE
ncbi:FtsX-like permease family protein [Promicromonospora umidemergens]|uniref:ABC transporter permease n=1 Tax=Promicromonospora umidemergens TaxID=629679 RepID=A0ABP8WPP6_9MICO|nr:ABC transporter permease [Promicromonospora umidemergens]MCP2283346.1 FtsX-like permease family protein [Promicromonospora umidemergens]